MQSFRRVPFSARAVLFSNLDLLTGSVDLYFYLIRLSAVAGPNADYDAFENSNGVWTKQASPNWWDIEYVEFHFEYTPNNDKYNQIDGLRFHSDRWEGTASTSPADRDLEVTDDKLHSDRLC